MLISRVGTVISVFLLMALLTLVDIEVGRALKPTFTHGQNIQHSEGTIESINSNQDFVLIMAKGQKERFHCRQHCLYQWSHLKRHYYEHALTDVYYVSGPRENPVAIDAD